MRPALAPYLSCKICVFAVFIFPGRSRISCAPLRRFPRKSQKRKGWARNSNTFSSTAYLSRACRAFRSPFSVLRGGGAAPCPACASTPPVSVTLCILCATLCSSEIYGSPCDVLFVSLSRGRFVASRLHGGSSCPLWEPRRANTPQLSIPHFVARLPRVLFSVLRSPGRASVPCVFVGNLPRTQCRLTARPQMGYSAGT